jgi:hypothetical protein
VLILWAMIYRKRALVLCCSFSICLNAFAQVAHTPSAGSEERKAIMDALRVPAEKDLGRKVIFRVDHLRVASNWAFARVVPLLPNGGEIDYSRTKYRTQLDEGAFDAEAECLLRRDGDGWIVLEWRFGATDTETQIWVEKYRIPKSLLD